MSAAASFELLASRLASLPSTLEQALVAPLPGGVAQRERLRGMARYVITGGGLSEGPARVMVALLRAAGRDARFVPQSAFVDWSEPPDAQAALVLFSQGLAPNARLPLYPLGAGLARGGGAAAFGLAVLVTAVAPGSTGMSAVAARLVEAGHLVWTLPPEREDRLLLRVVGPAVAVVAAVRLAELLAPGGVLTSPAECAAWADLPALVAARLVAPAPDLFGAVRRSVAFVAESRLLDLAMPLRWKLLEGLRVPDPPVWDPLQIAHGPLQAFYEERISLVLLRGSPSRQDALYARLARVLRTAGEDPPHRLVELRASVPGPAALVELDAALDAALLETLRHHPLSLDDWPSRGEDGPLYDVDPDELDREEVRR